MINFADLVVVKDYKGVPTPVRDYEFKDSTIGLTLREMSDGSYELIVEDDAEFAPYNISLEMQFHPDTGELIEFEESYSTLEEAMEAFNMAYAIREHELNLEMGVGADFDIDTPKKQLVMDFPVKEESFDDIEKSFQETRKKSIL